MTTGNFLETIERFSWEIPDYFGPQEISYGQRQFPPEADKEPVFGIIRVDGG